MGFLDAFSSNDPQSEALRQGLLQMGLALMQGKGNAGQIIGQAGQQGVSGMQAFQDRQFKQKLQQEALAEIARKKVLEGREDERYQVDQNLGALGPKFMLSATQAGNAAALAQTGNVSPFKSTAAVQSANAQPGFDYQGLINAYLGAKGGLAPAMALQSAIKKREPTMHAVGPNGLAYFDEGKLKTILGTPSDAKDKTEQIKNYEYAVAHGFKGSLVDFAKQTYAAKAQVWADSRVKAAATIADAKAKASAGSALTTEDAQMMADQYIAGDKSVLVGLGRGAQSAANIVTVRKAIRETLQGQGKTGADMAAKLSEYSGMLAAQRTAGTRTANIEVAGTAFESVVPIAKAASQEVSRSGLLPFGKVQIMFNEQTNNAAFRKFAAANNALVNLYARAINPTGVGTVHDKVHAREILMTAHDNESYQATVDQMLAEINAERKGLPSVRARFGAEIAGHGAPPAGADDVRARADAILGK